MIRIKTETYLVREAVVRFRRATGFPLRREMLSGTADVVRVFQRRLASLTHERMVGLFLDFESKPLGFVQVDGGENEAQLDPRVVLRAMLLCGADDLILIHNHPKGNAKPSKGDVMLSRRFAYLLGLFGMKLLDHIIIAPKADSISTVKW